MYKRQAKITETKKNKKYVCGGIYYLSKKTISNLIGEEDKKNPLSDSDLVDKLKENDFLVARRTVAKYRQLLNIKNINQRKE